MNEQLCDWLDEELGMEELAGALKDVLRLRGSVEKFVLTILKASRIYREPEMIRIQNVLEHLKNQKAGKTNPRPLFCPAGQACPVVFPLLPYPHFQIICANPCLTLLSSI